MVTYLEPQDWLEAHLAIFRDDTAYGFANQVNPDDNVFKQYNVIQSMPEVLGQLPLIWDVCEGFAPEGDDENRPYAFLEHFVAHIDLYLIVDKAQRLNYDDKVWTVPSSAHSPEPTNNLLFLLVEYVGRKIMDNITIETSHLCIQHLNFVDGEFYYAGVQMFPNARGVRIGLTLEVQRE